MNEQHIKNVVEAAMLAAGRPLQPDEMRDLFDEFERPEVDDVKAALSALAADYEGRGLELREVASGFRIQVRDSVAAPVSRLWQERPAKYSRAFLETLALIAYRQPITRGEIEEIRGVAVNPNIVKTLMERGWVRVVGHREVPGRPEVLGTTREFLDYFGLKSLDDLPTLAQLRDIETLGVQLEFAATAPAAPEAADVQAPEANAGADTAAEGDAPVSVEVTGSTVEVAEAVAVEVTDSSEHVGVPVESDESDELPASGELESVDELEAADDVDAGEVDASGENAELSAATSDDDQDEDEDAGDRRAGADEPSEEDAGPERQAAGLVAGSDASAERREPRD